MSKQHQQQYPCPSSTKSTLQWVVRTSSPGHIAYWTKHEEEEVWVKKQQQRRSPAIVRLTKMEDIAFQTIGALKHTKKDPFVHNKCHY